MIDDIEWIYHTPRGEMTDDLYELWLDTLVDDVDFAVYTEIFFVRL